MRLTSFSVLAVAGIISLASPALAAPAVTLAEAGFSAGPGTDYDISKKLGIGTHVNVLWCGTHENWCLVDIHNQRGWVPLASLNFKIPHAVTTDGGGTSGGGVGGTGAVGPGGKPAGQQPEAMATKGPGGGGGMVFTPVNNYQVVKLP